MSNHKDRTTKLQYGRLFTQKLTQQRRRDGLCLNCGKPARAGKTQCQECADYHTRRRIEIRKELKRKAVEYLGGRCVDCGIQSDYSDIYDFHHLLPVEKAAKIARLLDTTKSWEKVRIELDKCVLLCANCHRIRHAKEDEGAPLTRTSSSHAEADATDTFVAKPPAQLGEEKENMLERQGWTREDDTVLQHIYPRASDSEVAKQMQRTVWSVKSRAKRLHLTKDAEYRAVLNQTKAQHLREVNLTYHINHGYFSRITTRDQAYWLGWLWSDGCVGHQGESYTIELELHKKDVRVLEHFREAIETDYPLHYRRDAVRLHITSRQMFQDLGKLGIIPQKSVLATQPDIGETFVADFIRGVFDGDGYLSIAKTKVAAILGTESFCYWLQAITQQEIGIRSAVYRKKNTTFRWAINAQEMIRLFAQWIYRANEDGSLPFHLERKYARFVSLSLV